MFVLCGDCAIQAPTPCPCPTPASSRGEPGARLRSGKAAGSVLRAMGLSVQAQNTDRFCAFGHPPPSPLSVSRTRCHCRIPWCTQDFRSKYEGGHFTKVLPRDEAACVAYLQHMRWANKQGEAVFSEGDMERLKQHIDGQLELRVSIVHFFECDVTWNGGAPTLMVETQWEPSFSNQRAGRCPLPERPRKGVGGIETSLRFQSAGRRSPTKRAGEETDGASGGSGSSASSSGGAAGKKKQRGGGTFGHTTSSESEAPEIIPPWNFVADWESILALIAALQQHAAKCHGRFFFDRSRALKVKGMLASAVLVCNECEETYAWCSSSSKGNFNSLLAIAIFTTPVIFDHAMQFLKAVQFMLPGASNLYTVRRELVRPLLRQAAAASTADLLRKYRPNRKRFAKGHIPSASMDVGYLGQPAQHATLSLMDTVTGDALVFMVNEPGGTPQSWEMKLCTQLMEVKLPRQLRCTVGSMCVDPSTGTRAYLAEHVGVKGEVEVDVWHNKRGIEVNWRKKILATFELLQSFWKRLLAAASAAGKDPTAAHIDDALDALRLRLLSEWRGTAEAAESAVAGKAYSSCLGPEAAEFWRTVMPDVNSDLLGSESSTSAVRELNHIMREAYPSGTSISNLSNFRVTPETRADVLLVLVNLCPGCSTEGCDPYPKQDVKVDGTKRNMPKAETASALHSTNLSSTCCGLFARSGCASAVTDTSMATAAHS